MLSPKNHQQIPKITAKISQNFDINKSSDNFERADTSAVKNFPEISATTTCYGAILKFNYSSQSEEVGGGWSRPVPLPFPAKWPSFASEPTE